MTNRFFSPNQQFFTNPVDGSPLAGGKLYFYETNSSTPLDTYTSEALSVANANPVILDSNGYSGNIFLANQAYKVVLKDSNDVQIFTADPVWASDYSTMAQVLPWAGNPNGQVAGVAGVQGALPGSSMIWDYTNNILYICTTTGDVASATWTAVNDAAATPSVTPPQGYLTPTSGTPIIPTDVVSATALYYTPYVGNSIPIYNGSEFSAQTFSELTLTLSASNAINALYDVFVINDSGVLTLVTGPAWTTSTAGSGARGSGAGTTELVRFSGLWVNAVQITGRNGANSYTVGANLGTYVGTIYIDGTAGQVSCYRTFGQNRKWGVWNAYNRQNIEMVMGDSTASWAYAVGTIRQSNNSTSNKLTTLCGLPEEVIYLSLTQKMGQAVQTGANTAIFIGIGVNSTTTTSGVRAVWEVSSSANNADILTGQAFHTMSPGIGINNVNSLESGATVGTTTFYGTESYMRLTARWRG